MNTKKRVASVAHCIQPQEGVFACPDPALIFSIKFFTGTLFVPFPVVGFAPYMRIINRKEMSHEYD